jgi:glycosyltransferase involved in cell wall biosynthesis
MARSVHYFTDSAEIGGAENALLLLIESLDKREWRPTLLHTAGSSLSPLLERARDLGADVREVPPMPLGLAGARRVPAFVRALRQDRPQVFHAYLSWPLAAKYPLFAAVIARVPAVVATVQLFPDFPIGHSNYVQERLLAAFVGRYVAVSQDIATRLVETFHWPPRKVEVIHNGVLIERFQESPDPTLRRELAGGSDAPVVLTLARLDPQKGLDVLVRAAAQVPSVRFVLAGEGPERRSLETQVRSLGLDDRFLFLGRRSDVPALLAASDVFVLPSLYEGSSLAVLEAMAAGKPVISSAIRGTDELVVPGESGLLVEPGDADALALSLRRVLAEPAFGAQLGARAHERARQFFSADLVAKRVSVLYEDLLDRASTHAKR